MKRSWVVFLLSPCLLMANPVEDDGEFAQEEEIAFLEEEDSSVLEDFEDEDALAADEAPEERWEQERSFYRQQMQQLMHEKALAKQRRKVALMAKRSPQKRHDDSSGSRIYEPRQNPSRPRVTHRVPQQEMEAADDFDGEEYGQSSVAEWHQDSQAGWEKEQRRKPDHHPGKRPLEDDQGL